MFTLNLSDNAKTVPLLVQSVERLLNITSYDLQLIFNLVDGEFASKYTYNLVV